MASYWDEALSEKRRDMVWALLTIGGLIYDLERQGIVGIVGLVPRPDTLPVLALGLGDQWEQSNAYEQGSGRSRIPTLTLRTWGLSCPCIADKPQALSASNGCRPLADPSLVSEQ
jgi:hypothetical protein